MAIAAPTEVEIPQWDPSVRDASEDYDIDNMEVNFNTSFRGEATIVVTFTPSIYKEFVCTIEHSHTVSADENMIEVALEDATPEVMRGIDYIIGVSIKSSTDQSPFAYQEDTVEIPFPFASSTVFGFYGGVTIRANRISDKVFSTGELEYTGTWFSFPKITLSGPFNFCKILNTGTMAVIEIEEVVEEGHIRILETDPRKEQFGLWGGEDADNLRNTTHGLLPASDIRNFTFPPSNLLVRPLSLQVYFYGREQRDGSGNFEMGVSKTKMEVEYGIRYWGI